MCETAVLNGRPPMGTVCLASPYSAITHQPSTQPGTNSVVRVCCGHKRGGQTRFRCLLYVTATRENTVWNRRPSMGVIRPASPSSAVTHRPSRRPVTIPVSPVCYGHTREHRMEQATSDGDGSPGTGLFCRHTSPLKAAKHNRRLVVVAHQAAVRTVLCSV